MLSLARTGAANPFAFNFDTLIPDTAATVAIDVFLINFLLFIQDIVKF